MYGQFKQQTFYFFNGALISISDIPYFSLLALVTKYLLITINDEKLVIIK
jgi:hypothetical protein